MTTSRSQFYSSTIWVPGDGLRPSGLAGSTFTHREILLPSFLYIILRGKKLDSTQSEKHQCRTNNINPETETEIQAKNQKSKAAKSLAKSYLYQD